MGWGIDPVRSGSLLVASLLMTLATLLSDAATQNPTGISLIGLDRSFTWSETYSRAKRLAVQLVESGVKVGDRVAVMRTKGHETFEAIHAILMSGAILVPIDPLAPVPAVHAVLANSGASAVIGETQVVTKYDPWSAGNKLDVVLVSDDPTDERMVKITELEPTPDEIAKLPEVKAEDPAYLVYTSGSTGEPKGILHTHRSGLAYARLAVEAHKMGPDDRLVATSAAHFDMGTLELYACPLAQTSVIMLSEGQLRFPASLTARVEEHSGTMFYAVTTLLQSIVDRGALDQRDVSKVTKILFAGERYPPAALVKLSEAFSNAALCNVYGPAEVNACNVYHLDGPPDPERGSSIGPAWPGAELLVVDPSGAPVPDGEKGELWVSAVTRMSGYWENPELTASASHPRADGPDWYKTGDIVSKDKDGLYWFHGRKDSQVKIRGMRLELEAIESVLGEAPNVLYAVAGTQETSSEVRLLAVLVPIEGTEIDLKEVKRFCQKRLHPNAIPQSLSIQSSFPKTPSGKIDRTAVRSKLGSEQNS